MNKLKWYALTMLLSLFAIDADAQAYEIYFTVDDFEIAAGETKIVKVSMASKEENVYGFQVRLTIPEELSFVPVSGTGTRAKYAVLSYDRAPADDGYTITTTSNIGEIKSAVFLSKNDNAYPYYGTSGEIFSFAVKASEDITVGKHNIMFSEAEIVKNINVPINPDNFGISATVLPIETSITDDISADKGNGMKFDVSGKVVGENAKGIIIANGRKVAVK